MAKISEMVGMVEVEENNPFEEVASSQKSTDVYCSFPLTTIENKKRLFNALNGVAKPISDSGNEGIKIVDMAIDIVRMNDDQSGELRDMPRVTLFDDKGQVWYSTSGGIYDSIKALIASFGNPTWADGILVKHVMVKSRKGRIVHKIELA